MRYEIPPRFEGTAETQLEQLWRYLYRLVERLNVENPGGETSTAEGGFTAKAYTELREMIGSVAKDKVSHDKLRTELQDALRQAEESGDFDGNGINFVTTNADYSVTFGFTDGTFYTTPPLGQISVGDVFSTTRAGDPAELLGYGTWRLLSSSPAYMWERLS